MFQNISFFTRLIISTGVLIFALFANTLVGWLGFRAIAQSVEEVYRGGVNEIFFLSNLKSLYEVNVIDTTQKVRDGIINWREAEEAFRNAIRNIESTLTTYVKNFYGAIENSQALDASVKAEIDNLQRQVKTSQVQLEKVFDIIKQQNIERLNLFAVRELYSLTDPIIGNIERLIHWHIGQTQDDYKIAESNLGFYRNLIILTFILALILTCVITFLVIESIIRPLQSAVETIDRVATGDLTIQKNATSNDEVGRLFTSMYTMVDSDRKIAEALSKFSLGELNLQIEPRSEKDILTKSLNDMIHSSRKMSEFIQALTNGDLSISPQIRSEHDVLGSVLVSMTKKLRQMIGSIQSDVIALTNASQEVVTSVSQVAISSSETATAVTETTTTVEELKQTAQVSAEKANDVLARAEETLQIVKTSEKSLQSTIEDMNQINARMHSISEGIIKLSELSQTIGEIIDTVNDLAEQSNLLAVNAAIEAAKAGEQGKGFGVVAQEIRTLAEQSKAATVQVRAILNDIQNATSAAVLATEQGSKAVEKGVDQSSQTSESMRTLVTSMGHVAQAANQIAISSQQQLVGVDQVNMAMNNINEATKQHIENMKNIENAVVAFNSIGQTLKQITDQYVLNDSQKKKRRFESDKEELNPNYLEN